MGIKDFTKLLKDCGVDLYSKPIDQLGSGYLVIDTSISIYQAVTAIRARGKDLTTDEGMITSHIYVIIYRILRMIRYGIIPIFVFDGATIEEKLETIEKRRSLKTNDSFKITNDIKQSTQLLVNLLGLPYVISTDEADPVCGYIATKYKKKVLGVVTEDTDILMYGTPIIIKGFFKKETLVIELDKVKKGLGLNQDELIDLANLLGNDYVSRIKGVGPKTALKLIKQHCNIENVVKKIPKSKQQNIPENYEFLIERARCIFKNSGRYSKLVNENKLFCWKEPKYNRLTLFLTGLCKFLPKRVDNIKTELRKEYKNWSGSR